MIEPLYGAVTYTSGGQPALAVAHWDAQCGHFVLEPPYLLTLLRRRWGDPRPRDFAALRQDLLTRGGLTEVICCHPLAPEVHPRHRWRTNAETLKRAALTALAYAAWVRASAKLQANLDPGRVLH